MSNPIEQAQLIWVDDPALKINSVAVFRKKFKLTSPKKNLALAIAADTDFVVYCDGIEIGRNQFPDYPEHKTYSTFKIPLLLNNEHIIAIKVFYCGEIFSTYTPGTAGVIMALFDPENPQQPLCKTDSTWVAQRYTPYGNNLADRVTFQLNFVQFFDARLDFDFAAANFDDRHFQLVKCLPRPFNHTWQTLTPRPLPPLDGQQIYSSQIIEQGRLMRHQEYNTFAQSVHFDRLIKNDSIPSPSEPGMLEFRRPEDFNGFYLIADFGEERFGFLCLDFYTTQECVIDISHGEHLEDHRVRNYIDGRNFTDRYIAKIGENHFELHFRRMGCRYIQLNITNCTQMPHIKQIILRSCERQLPPLASFECDNLLHEKLYKMSVRTLKLCMHDHYEDCPWREQALYAYDSRNQALYGYYLWGNYPFARESFRMLGRGVQRDNFLNLCAPSCQDFTIPIFSFVWVCAIYEYFLYSDDLTLFSEFKEQIENIIHQVQQFEDKSTGLYYCKNDQNLWNFYEWSEDLYTIGCPENELHAPYNLYFLEMIVCYAKLLRLDNEEPAADKYEQLAQKLRQNIHNTFFDYEKNCYASKKLNGKFASNYHNHIQFLALYNQIVPRELTDKVIEVVLSGTLHPITLSALPYMLNSMFNQNEETRKYAVKTIEEIFAAMSDSESKCLWETAKGAEDFDLAGSLCHGWSALDIYLLYGYLLGVKPLSGGFREFEFAPCPLDIGHLKSAIPTPHGKIEIDLEQRSDGIHAQVKHPKQCKLVLKEHQQFPIAQLIIESF